MPPFLTWTLMALGILAGVFLCLIIVGSFLPRTHIVSRSLSLAQDQATVWQFITDFALVPSWHPEVHKVERLADKNGHEVWRETYRGGYPLQLETMECTPQVRLVRSIADENGPFRGRWEFNLTPSPSPLPKGEGKRESTAGCSLTITEFGEIPNPFFRLMARMFMDPAMYLEMYLKALAKKFGQEAKIEK